MVDEIEFQENPERGTAGISSAFQLVESTDFPSMEFGTAPDAIHIFPVGNDISVKREKTFKEKLAETIRRHKPALDKLDKF